MAKKPKNSSSRQEMVLPNIVALLLIARDVFREHTLDDIHNIPRDCAKWNYQSIVEELDAKMQDAKF